MNLQHTQRLYNVVRLLPQCATIVTRWINLLCVWQLNVTPAATFLPSLATINLSAASGHGHMCIVGKSHNGSSCVDLAQHISSIVTSIYTGWSVILHLYSVADTGIALGIEIVNWTSYQHSEKTFNIYIRGWQKTSSKRFISDFGNLPR